MSFWACRSIENRHANPTYFADMKQCKTVIFGVPWTVGKLFSWSVCQTPLAGQHSNFIKNIVSNRPCSTAPYFDGGNPRDVQKIMCVRPFVRPSVSMFWGPFLDLKIPVSPLMVPFGRSKKGSRAWLFVHDPISRDLDRPGKWWPRHIRYFNAR